MIERNLMSFIILLFSATIYILIVGKVWWADPNNLVEWEKESFIPYIQSLEYEESEIKKVSVIKKHNKEDYYYVEAKFGQNETFEGIAKINKDSKKDIIRYKKMENTPREWFKSYQNSYYMVEIELNKVNIDLSLMDEEKTMHHVYPGVEERDGVRFIISILFLIVFVIPSAMWAQGIDGEIIRRIVRTEEEHTQIEQEQEQEQKPEKKRKIRL